ncbi:MAG TPA: hypothetical protein VFB66_25770 [Tepidisphaeraceae bacterium]|nr:hypothetical protein [Tepidisphaeraceae bacterium]
MSTYPSPNQPYYPNYSQPTAAARPTAVTVFAILGIVFGIMGLLCKPLALLPLFVSGQLAQGNPGLAAMNDPAMRTMVIASVVVGVPVSILLLAGGIGSLNLKPWARKVMLAYAALAILLCIVNVVTQLVWMVPAMAEVQAQQPQQPNMPNVAAFAKAGGYAGAIVEFVLRLIFPILLLYFFTRPNVVAAFEGRTPGGSAGYGGGYGGGGYAPNAFPQQQPGGYYAGQPAPQGQVPQPPGPYTAPPG